MNEAYGRLFGEQPNDKVYYLHYLLKLKGDHPELDT